MQALQVTAAALAIAAFIGFLGVQSTDGRDTGFAFMLFVPLFALGAIVYITPTVIAHHRGHHQRQAITLLNILLGWTFLGWVAAMVWANTAPQLVTISVLNADPATRHTEPVLADSTMAEPRFAEPTFAEPMLGDPAQHQQPRFVARDADAGLAGDEKVCPECAETVRAAARICRYCRYEFRPAA